MMFLISSRPFFGKKKWPTDKVPRKVPKEVYTDDFRNEVEVPRSIMETGDRTQKMLHWKEGVATESLTVRLTIADGETAWQC